MTRTVRGDAPAVPTAASHHFCGRTSAAAPVPRVNVTPDRSPLLSATASLSAVSDAGGASEPLVHEARTRRPVASTPSWRLWCLVIASIPSHRSHPLLDRFTGVDVPGIPRTVRLLRPGFFR